MKLSALADKREQEFMAMKTLRKDDVDQVFIEPAREISFDEMLREERTPGPAFKLELDAKRLGLCLAHFIALLFVGHIVCKAAFYGFGVTAHRHLLNLFDLDEERNISSLYSAAALLFSSGLLYMVARSERQRRQPSAAWMILAMVFAFLAADEAVSIHEYVHLGGYPQSGFLYYTWVIPYGLIAAGLALLYLPFLKRLPNRICTLFVVSGLIYVGGAIGCEIIGGLVIQSMGRYTLAYELEILCEETMEMSGIALFIYAIISHIQAEFPGTNVRASFGPRRRTNHVRRASI